MRHFVIGCLLLTSLSAFAESSNISVVNIGNSCAPWDGHAIAFNFKDNSVENKTINVSIWKWDALFPFQTKFNFTKRNNVGNLNICNVKDGKPVCELEEGSISLNKSFKSFSVGDFVEGDVIITNPTSLSFHFKYTIPAKQNKEPVLCG